MNNIAGSAGKVKVNTPSQINQDIDKLTLNNIERYSSSPDPVISHRLRNLDKKWDIERLLEINMSTVALTGIALSLFVSRKWLYLPVLVSGFFIQHAIKGWCPPQSIFRALKVRTRSEIDQEKYALKALRGDFIGIKDAEEALSAVQEC